MERVSGPVQVTNENGGISTMGLKPASNGACQPVRLSTKFGEIKLALPADADYDLTARTKFGKIHSAVTIAMQGQISTENMSGRIGRGGCELSLINDNGGIGISAEQI